MSMNEDGSLKEFLKGCQERGADDCQGCGGKSGLDTAAAGHPSAAERRTAQRRRTAVQRPLHGQRPLHTAAAQRLPRATSAAAHTLLHDNL